MQPWIRDCLLHRDERLRVHQATTTVIATAAMTVLLFCAYAWSISGSRGGSFEYLVLAAALTMLGCLSASVLLGVLTYATLRYLVSTPQPQAIKLLAAGLGALLLSTILFFGFAAPGTLVAEGVRHQAPGLVALFGASVSEPATFEFRDAQGQRYTLGSAPFYALTASGAVVSNGGSWSITPVGGWEPEPLKPSLGSSLAALAPAVTRYVYTNGNPYTVALAAPNGRRGPLPGRITITALDSGGPLWLLRLLGLAALAGLAGLAATASPARTPPVQPRRIVRHPDVLRRGELVPTPLVPAWPRREPAPLPTDRLAIHVAGEMQRVLCERATKLNRHRGGWFSSPPAVAKQLSEFADEVRSVVAAAHALGDLRAMPLVQEGKEAQAMSTLNTLYRAEERSELALERERIGLDRDRVALERERWELEKDQHKAGKGNAAAADRTRAPADYLAQFTLWLRISDTVVPEWAAGEIRSCCQTAYDDRRARPQAYDLEDPVAVTLDFQQATDNYRCALEKIREQLREQPEAQDTAAMAEYKRYLARVREIFGLMRD